MTSALVNRYAKPDATGLALVRTGYETADTQGVLDGDLNAFMKEYLMNN